METELTKKEEPKKEKQDFELSNQLTFDQVQRLAGMFAASGYFKDVTDVAKAGVKILAGAELGISPMAAMNGIYMVNGRPSLSAQLMASCLIANGFKYKIVAHSAKVCTIEFWRSGELLGVSTFTIEQAVEAKLADKDVWKNYPENMLFARAMSNGARWFCPDAFRGGQYYTPEEMSNGEVVSVDQDYEDAVYASPTQQIEQQESLTLDALKVAEEQEIEMEVLS